ncbi:DUF1080 domain-containing protein [Blastopirellula sp. JC732]|uniref:DUF1080 domain-containing protein n=1 Tax=Blastopirellula sediminis TaxID=2894196 RepID=A0A9X1MM91_9BACT|nr:DUF1080 domain-containing protein [Blastopirellula sediminis]MCC9608301.1 DUF1080 domain-containing protein [Blastopirellula sediminis]MCC9628922.1 DUF1080 domain-containing protein [Blastopirellula sediminis]
MKTNWIVGVVAICVLSTIQAASGDDSTTPWRDLFNGKDLTGWEANLHPDSFSVVDGLLKVHADGGMAHLFYVGDTGQDVTLKDFELTAIVRAEPNSNSGIFFHTDRELRGGRNLAKGYEVQLNSSPKDKHKTGSLYSVVVIDQPAVDETKWFEIRVKVQGKRIEVFVEGHNVVDYTEPENPVREAIRAKRLIDDQGGAIAIQAHGPKSVFYFKQIRVRELK